MHKRLFAILLVISLTILLAGGIVYGADYNIKLGHVEVEHSATHEGALEFKKLVEERTDGQVEVNIYPHSQLGSGPDQGEMIQAGSLEMGILPAGHIGGIFPEVQLFDIPFLLPGNLEDANEVINGPAADVMFSYLKDKDMVGLANFALSYKQYTCNEPIREPDDFKGLKIRCMASPIIVASFREMGASTMVIDYHELYTALQLGTVDGEENPYWSIGEMKFYEVQDYVIESNHALFASTFVANQQWFESLPADIQQTIKEVAEEITTTVYQEQHEIDEKYKKVVQEDETTEIIVLTPEQRQKFIDALQPVKDVYVERLGDSGQEILDAFVEEVEKYR